MTRESAQQGQVALVVLSITAILTVISTLLIQRTVLEQRLSRQTEEQALALNYAETEVEDLLANIEDVFAAAPGDPSEIKAVNTNYDRGEVSYELTKTNQIEGFRIKENRTRDLDIDPSSKFTVNWVGVNGETALLLTFTGENGGVRRIIYVRDGGAYDSVDGAEKIAGLNSFTIDLAPGGDAKFDQIRPVNSVRIKALYGDVDITVRGVNVFPVQEYEVEVEAKLDSNTSTNVAAEQTRPQLPSVFDYALFSGGNISKNSN